MYFAKLMHRVLEIARRKGIAFTFFNDTCIFAKTWSRLMENFKCVLSLLKEANLTLNLKKCRFGIRRVEYLGYIIGEGSIRPGEVKVKAIEDFPRPDSKHDVRWFMGLASFFRRFVSSFANIALPLTNLLKESVEFNWSINCKEAFSALKQKLVETPILKVYNPKAYKTQLHTDASSKGIGAILLQAEKEGNPSQMIYAVSRRTSEVEEKYHSSRLELMAFAWAQRYYKSRCGAGCQSGGTIDIGHHFFLGIEVLPSLQLLVVSMVTRVL